MNPRGSYQWSTGPPLEGDRPYTDNLYNVQPLLPHSSIHDQYNSQPAYPQQGMASWTAQAQHQAAGQTIFSQPYIAQAQQIQMSSTQYPMHMGDAQGHLQPQQQVTPFIAPQTYMSNFQYQPSQQQYAVANGDYHNSPRSKPNSPSRSPRTPRSSRSRVPLGNPRHVGHFQQPGPSRAYHHPVSAEEEVADKSVNGVSQKLRQLPIAFDERLSKEVIDTLEGDVNAVIDHDGQKGQFKPNGVIIDESTRTNIDFFAEGNVVNLTAREMEEQRPVKRAKIETKTNPGKKQAGTHVHAPPSEPAKMQPVAMQATGIGSTSSRQAVNEPEDFTSLLGDKMEFSTDDSEPFLNTGGPSGQGNQSHLATDDTPSLITDSPSNSSPATISPNSGSNISMVSAMADASLAPRLGGPEESGMMEIWKRLASRQKEEHIAKLGASARAYNALKLTLRERTGSRVEPDTSSGPTMGSPLNLATLSPEASGSGPVIADDELFDEFCIYPENNDHMR